VAGECMLIVEDERAVARGLEYGLRAEDKRQPILMLTASSINSTGIIFTSCRMGMENINRETASIRSASKRKKNS
jgi:hypothetical protein